MGLILSKELFIWNTAIISIAVLLFPQVSVFSEKLWKKERCKVIWWNLCSERSCISMRLSLMRMVNQSKLSILKNNKFTHTTSSSKAISSKKYYKKRSDTTIER